MWENHKYGSMRGSKVYIEKKDWTYAMMRTGCLSGY